MKFVVKFGASTSYSLVASGHETLSQLMTCIEDITGVPQDRQTLILKGMKLHDKNLQSSISELGVKADSKLMLIGNAVVQPALQTPLVVDLSAYALKTPETKALPKTNKTVVINEVKQETIENILRTFKNKVSSLQQQHSRPVPGSTHTQLLQQGEIALTSLEKAVSNACASLNIPSSSNPASTSTSITLNVRESLPEFRRVTEEFCTHIQITFFDPVMTSDAEVVSRRRYLNQHISKVLKILEFPDQY
eukprot:c8942_g1_i1.p1 GENE.c8942_g1_i1~~c8942_g1_i1.p1  ORF type:complete len:257 (+),score=58.71 c8942_g1_i1:26-772(+)